MITEVAGKKGLFIGQCPRFEVKAIIVIILVVKYKRIEVVFVAPFMFIKTLDQLIGGEAVGDAQPRAVKLVLSVIEVTSPVPGGTLFCKGKLPVTISRIKTILCSGRGEIKKAKIDGDNIYNDARCYSSTTSYTFSSFFFILYFSLAIFSI
jgi:hypothetical protein